VRVAPVFLGLVGVVWGLYCRYWKSRPTRRTTQSELPPRSSVSKASWPAEDHRLKDQIDAIVHFHGQTHVQLHQDSRVSRTYVAAETSGHDVGTRPLILVVVLGCGLFMFLLAGREEMMGVLAVVGSLASSIALSLAMFRVSRAQKEATPSADAACATVALPANVHRNVLQAASLWLTQAPAGRIRGFGARADLKILVEANRSNTAQDEFEAVVLGTPSEASQGSVSVHHYICCPGLAPSSSLLAEQRLRDLLESAGVSQLVSDVPSSDPQSDGAQCGRRALDEARDRSDAVDGEDANWVDEGMLGAVHIHSLNVPGAKYPLFKGVLEVSGDELRDMGHGGCPPTVAEIFTFMASWLGQWSQSTEMSTKRVVQWLGTDAWLSHMTTHATDYDAAREGVYLTAVRRTVNEDGSELRMTMVMIPAPDELVEPLQESIAAIRGEGRFKKSIVRNVAHDVCALPDGGLRVCSMLHVNPEVSFVVPSFMVRGFLRTRATSGAIFLEMAQHMRIPPVVLLQSPDADRASEDLVEALVSGNLVLMPRVLAAVVADNAGC